VGSVVESVEGSQVSAQPKAVADTIKSEKDLKAVLEAVAASATGKTKTDLEKIIAEQFISVAEPPRDRWVITITQTNKLHRYHKPGDWPEERVAQMAAALAGQLGGASSYEHKKAGS
jgi:hypothetical protein